MADKELEKLKTELVKVNDPNSVYERLYQNISNLYEMGEYMQVCDISASVTNCVKIAQHKQP